MIRNDNLIVQNDNDAFGRDRMVFNMDDAGDTAPTAVMAMIIAHTCITARLIHAVVTRGLQPPCQAWRTR